MKKICNILFTAIISLLLVIGFVACTPTTGPKTYTVTFNTQGICEVSSQTVKENELATRPFPDPVSEYYNFEGWYADVSFEVEYDFSSPITKNTTVFAKWSVKESTYTITFNNNGRGKTPAKQYIEAGTNGKITKPADLSSNGWKFVGWSLSKDGKENLIDFDTFVPTSSVTLYAQWLQVFTISFDLNNTEAMDVKPANQSVEDGKLATKPDDPFVYGYEFLGWYTDVEDNTPFDFSTPIASKLTLYAKWSNNTIGFIDGSDLPSYEFERDGAYGERPDLDGYVIDGKKGDKENWDEQKWYHNGISEAPTVSYDISTQFSEKGLYVFMQAYDNGGLAFMGRGYHYKNTGWELWIGHPHLNGYANNVNVKQFIIDTYNVKGDLHCAKVAINITEGEINPIGENKYGSFAVELFITWDELGLLEKPEYVNIFATYKYKRLQSATSTLGLTTPFATTYNTPYHYLPFDESGFILADSENATVGDSPFGVSKTSGWDISAESSEENAFVQTTVANNTTQLLFFKNVQGNYYEVETKINPSQASLGGRAGIIIYNSKTLYSAITFEMNSSTIANGKFVKIRPRYSITDKNGNPIHKFLDEMEGSEEVKLKVIFSNGYVYFILNDKLFYCEFIETLSDRTTPGLYVESSNGVKFFDYKSKNHTESSALKESSKYAYVISAGRLSHLSVSFSTMGVSVDGNNDVTMYLNHSMVSFSNATRDKILQNNDFSGVSMYELETIAKTVDGETVDFTNEFIDPTNGAKSGEYTLKSISGNTQISSTSRKVDTNNLTAIIVKLRDNFTGGDVNSNATVTIKSNNPRLSAYAMNVTKSEVVAVVQKGYDYQLIISCVGYRAQILETVYNVVDRVTLDDVIMVNNVVGGTASSKTDNSFTQSSTYAMWDYSNENEGYVVAETPDYSKGLAFFNGKTIAKYQVFSAEIANILNSAEYSKYEGDPAAGFVIITKAGARSFIGLHRNGIRVLKNQGGIWDPTHFHTMNYSVINKPDPTGNTKARLTVIKIDKSGRADCYIFVDDTFIAKVELDGRGGETAVALDITSSYQSKIKFSNYWIKTDDEAILEAERLGAVSLDYDDTCYDFNDEYETDYNKPIIEIKGLERLPLSDGKTKELAFIGGQVIVALNTQYVYDGIAYTVKVGNLGSVVLTKSNPEAKLNVSALGKFTISIEMAQSTTVKGKVVLRDGKELLGAIGTLTDESGRVISFVLDESGAFSVDVYASTYYTINVEKDGYVCEKFKFKSDASGKIKDIGQVYLQYLVLGGKSPAGITSGMGMTVGYGYESPYNAIDGAYYEVSATGDNGQAYNVSLVEDVIIKFSYFRQEIKGIEKNEHNPAIGLRLIANNKAEFYGFWQDGAVMLPVDIGWNDRRAVLGVMGGKVSEYDKAFDFIIIRRGMSITLLGKVATDSEYKLVTTYTSSIAFGKATMLIHCTNGNPNHYFIYNVDINEYSDALLPSSMVRQPTITANEGGTYEISGSSHSESGKFIIGDEIKVKLIPNSGKTVAFVKVDGKLIGVANNVASFVVTNTFNLLEIGFEDAYNKYDVMATIKTESGELYNGKVSLTAVLSDGREYLFDNLSVENGTARLTIREGDMTVYAQTDAFYSKAKNVTVSDGITSIGEFVLSVRKIGSVVANGVKINTNEAKKWKYEPLKSEYINTDSDSCNWLQNSTVCGDFIIEADITLNTGDKNSPYYTPDRVTGFMIGNGTKMMAFMLNLNGFRISSGGWSTTEMVETHNGGVEWYPQDVAKDVTHKFTIVRKGGKILLFVDGKKECTVDGESGAVSEYGNKPNTTGGTGNAIECNTWIKNRVADMFASNETEFAVGLIAHIGGNLYNRAGVSNLKITTSYQELAKYN